LAVEDNPQWPEWSAAYDELVAAVNELRSCSQLSSSDPSYQIAKARHAEALAKYNRISALLD
jgi:hypothetical protein